MSNERKAPAPGKAANAPEIKSAQPNALGYIRTKRPPYRSAWQREQDEAAARLAVEKEAAAALLASDTPTGKPPPRSTSRPAVSTRRMIGEGVNSSRGAYGPVSYTTTAGEAVMPDFSAGIQRSYEINAALFWPAWPNVPTNSLPPPISNPRDNPFTNKIPTAPPTPMVPLLATPTFEQVSRTLERPASRVPSRRYRVDSAPGLQSAPHHRPPSDPSAFLPGPASQHAPLSPGSLSINLAISHKLENKFTCAINARLLINPDTFGAELLEILSTICQSAEKAAYLVGTFPVAEGQRLSQMNEQQVRMESQLCLGQASGLIDTICDLTDGSTVMSQVRVTVRDLYQRMWEHDSRARSMDDLLGIQEYLAQGVDDNLHYQGPATTTAAGAQEGEEDVAADASEGQKG